MHRSLNFALSTVQHIVRRHQVQYAHTSTPTTRTRTRTHTQTRTQTHTHTHTRAHRHKHTHPHTRTRTRTHTHTHTHTQHTHTHTHTHAHARTRTHTHAHAHISYRVSHQIAIKFLYSSINEGYKKHLDASALNFTVIAHLRDRIVALVSTFALRAGLIMGQQKLATL